MLASHDLILYGCEAIHAVRSYEDPLRGDDGPAAEVGDAAQEVTQGDLRMGDMLDMMSV